MNRVITSCFRWPPFLSCARIASLTLFMGVLLMAPHVRASPSDVDRVKQFQELLIASPVMGLPSADQLVALSPYLSNKLLERLRAATRAQQAVTRRAPMPEPPMIQGALFYSLFEGAARLVEVVPDGKTPSLLVTVEYLTGPNDPQPVRWTDRVMLVTENHQAVIDDIQFLGQWDFSRKGTLTETLDEVIAASKQ